MIYLLSYIVIIAVRSHERHGVSSHQSLDYLFNGLMRLISMQPLKLHITALGEGNPPLTDGIPSQRAIMRKNIIAGCICFTFRRTKMMDEWNVI